MAVFQDIKSLTGNRYHKSIYNRDIIDEYLLRRAREQGIRLPSGTEPDRINYFGAHVFVPYAGLSEHVVYLDLASLYPNLCRALNMSPETMVGTTDALDESSYTEDDCVWGYIDTRPVKWLSEDEQWANFTDGKYKMIYDPSAPKVRWVGEPTYEKCYYLHPSVQEGFVASTVDDLIDLKYKYEGSLYESIKRIVNSIYGYLSFGTRHTASRIYDWRMGESITLSGRKVIQHTAERAVTLLQERGYPNARVVIGDSVPAEEPVIIRDGEGDVDVVPIESLEGRDGGVEVWSDGGFTTVRRVIKKPNRKQMYVVRTKNGVVHVTEDHSLVLADGTEVSPEEVSEGDELLHQDLADIPYGEHDGITTDEAWLLGLFVADGSCNHYEYDHRYDKYPWAITKADVDLLEEASEKVESVFGVETKIRDTMESSGCYKLGTTNCANGQRKELVEEFRERCYVGDEKRIPQSVLNASEEIRSAFLDGYLSGDGHDEKAALIENNAASSKSPYLAAGIAMLVRERGHETTISRRENHGGKEYYRVRAATYHRGSSTVVRSVEEVDYEGEYVYDLETENHHFQAGVGSIVVHNTDGCGITLPSAESWEDCMPDVVEVAETINEVDYPTFMHETFGVDENAHYMDVEVESYARRLFVPAENPSEHNPEIGSKKRYGQWIQIEDEDDDPDVTFGSMGYEIVNDIDVTGFEYVRSDTADETQRLQYEVLSALLRDGTDARGEIFEACGDARQKALDNETDIKRLCKRKGIGQDLSEYGAVNRRPSPIYRGAKYADRFLDVEIGEGDKPLVYYVNGTGKYPSVYSAETAEDGDAVDAVSLPPEADLPDGFTVDRQRHTTKAVIDPLQPIIETMGWSWGDVKSETVETSLAEFM